MKARVTLEELIPGGLMYCSFYDNNKPNYIFANYWDKSAPLEIDGIKYETPEHYFQSQKFTVGSTEHTAILNARTADDARKEALRQNSKIVPGWHKGTSYDAMLNVVRARLKQDPDFKQALMATGDAYILEDTYKGPNGKPDNTWGGGEDGKGENKLGMALMTVRNQEFKRRSKNSLIVDALKFRNTAQKERDTINKQLGGPGSTRGKSLSELKTLLAPNHSHQTNSTYQRLGQALRTVTAKDRVMDKLKQHGAKDIAVIPGGKDPQVIKVTFGSTTAAQTFAKFAGGSGNPASTTNGGVSVILGPKRAENVFKRLSVGTHGKGNHPMFKALVYDAEMKTPKERVMDKLKHYNAKDITVIPGKQHDKVIKVTFNTAAAAKAFARFAGGRGNPAPITNNGVSVILGPNRAENVFTQLGVRNHGRTHPRPMFAALCYDDQQKSQPKPPSHKTTAVRKTPPARLNNTLDEKKLFDKIFTYIDDQLTSGTTDKVKKEVRKVFEDYQSDIENNKGNDMIDITAQNKLKAIKGLDLADKTILSSRMNAIKEAVAKNDPAFTFTRG
jgi:N-glycosidase YbiA